MSGEKGWIGESRQVVPILMVITVLESAAATAAATAADTDTMWKALRLRGVAVLCAACCSGSDARRVFTEVGGDGEEGLSTRACAQWLL